LPSKSSVSFGAAAFAAGLPAAAGEMPSSFSRAAATGLSGATSRIRARQREASSGLFFAERRASAASFAT
jgi:hypothetical protein